MSFGGILAQALAGGTAAIGKQAGDDIEAQRKADLMRQQADIEEQMRMRLSEFSEKQRRSGVLWETSGEGGAAKREYRKGELADASAADIAKARGMIPVTQEAALAGAQTATEITKKQAGDKDYLKSINVLKLADPEVRARVAQANAAAGASAQQVKESAERLKQLQAVGEVATKVRGIQDELSKTGDADRRQLLEQQITDLGFSGKDVKSFLSTAERAMTNGDTAMKVLLDPTASEETKATARKQLEAANQFAVKAAGLAGIKLDPTAAATDIPAAAIDYLKKNPTLKAEFDAKFGKGSADKVLAGGGGKPGGMAPGAARAATADDSNDRTIRRVGTGYGTGYYRYAGQNYPTQQAAEAAKAKWDGISADDYFKTPD